MFVWEAFWNNSTEFQSNFLCKAVLTARGSSLIVDHTELNIKRLCALGLSDFDCLSWVMSAAWITAAERVDESNASRRQLRHSVSQCRNLSTFQPIGHH